MTLTDDQSQWLYRFYRLDGALLYVGVTERGERRWSEHRKHAEWWAQVARRTIQRYDSREDVMLAERHAIYREKPLYNVIHNRTGRRLYGSEPIPADVPLTPEAHHDAALTRLARAYDPAAAPIVSTKLTGPRGELVSLADFRARRRPPSTV